MSALRLRVLVALAAAVGVAAWLLLDAWERSGHAALPMPWTAVAGLLVLAAVVLAAGLDVRRQVEQRSAPATRTGVPVPRTGAGPGRGRPLDPLRAARTAVLATAAAYTGAVLAGWYAGLAASIVPDLVGERRARMWLALAAAAAAVLLAVAGVLAQRWCRVPPSDDDPPESALS